MKRLLPTLIGLLAFCMVVGPAFGARRPKPTSGPTTRPALRPEVQQLISLTRKSLELLKDQKLTDAEKVLREAVKLDATSVINLYNLACVCALTNRGDEALAMLEQAAEAGYTDFVHMLVDPDLKGLHGLPRWGELVKKRDAYQRRAAERALESLKQQLGTGYIYEIDEPDRLIFATNVDRQTLDALKSDLKAQAKSQWKQIFEHKPDEFISIVVPSPADYKKFVKMPGVGGIYNDEGKILLARQLGQVVTHEFTHALHAADRAPLEQDHPIWLVEGLASLFEAAEWEERDGEQVLVPRDNFRLLALQRGAQYKKLIPLEKLFSMQQKEFVDKATFGYGESSSLLLYLYENDLLKKFYDMYKAGFEVDPTGKAALEQVCGKKLAVIEKEWIAWIKARPAPALTTGPDGAFLGASLSGIGSADANDGVMINVVLPDGPASKAGLKIGDILVGIDERAIHDFQTFGPVMSRYQPGDRVVLKVRRDGKYQEIPVVLGKRSSILEAIANAPPKRRSTTRPAP